MLRRQVPNRQAHGLAPCDALCAAGACKSRCSAPTARGRRSSATTSRLPTAKTTQAALARRARAAVRRASSCSEASGARRAASTRARCPSRPGTGCSVRTRRSAGPCGHQRVAPQRCRRSERGRGRVLRPAEVVEQHAGLHVAAPALAPPSGLHAAAFSYFAHPRRELGLDAPEAAAVE